MGTLGTRTGDWPFPSHLSSPVGCAPQPEGQRSEAGTLKIYSFLWETNPAHGCAYRAASHTGIWSSPATGIWTERKMGHKKLMQAAENRAAPASPAALFRFLLLYTWGSRKGEDIRPPSQAECIGHIILGRIIRWSAGWKTLVRVRNLQVLTK